MDISDLIAGAAFCLSAISIWLSLNARQEERHERDNDLINSLQAEYDSIRAQMSTMYRDDSWRPDPSNDYEWKPIESYWYLCYREWRLTKSSEGGRYSHLWESHFKPAIQAGYSHPPLRHVLHEMLKAGSMNGEYAQEFLADLKTIFNG